MVPYRLGSAGACEDGLIEFGSSKTGRLPVISSQAIQDKSQFGRTDAHGVELNPKNWGMDHCILKQEISPKPSRIDRRKSLAGLGAFSESIGPAVVRRGTGRDLPLRFPTMAGVNELKLSANCTSKVAKRANHIPPPSASLLPLSDFPTLICYSDSEIYEDTFYDRIIELIQLYNFVTESIVIILAS